MNDASSSSASDDAPLAPTSLFTRAFRYSPHSSPRSATSCPAAISRSHSSALRKSGIISTVDGGGASAGALVGRTSGGRDASGHRSRTRGQM